MHSSVCFCLTYTSSCRTSRLVPHFHCFSLAVQRLCLQIDSSLGSDPLWKLWDKSVIPLCCPLTYPQQLFLQRLDSHAPNDQTLLLCFSTVSSQVWLLDRPARLNRVTAKPCIKWGLGVFTYTLCNGLYEMILDIWGASTGTGHTLQFELFFTGCGITIVFFFIATCINV